MNLSWTENIFIYSTKKQKELYSSCALYSWGQKFASPFQGSNAHRCSRRKNHALRAGAWKLYEFEDQGKLHLFCLLGDILKGSTNWKKKRYLGKIRKISIRFISFHAPALNAWFLLLEHQRVFESSVIAAYESLSHPQCENMHLKIIQTLLEKVQIHKNAGKPKGLWDLKGFSEEQQQFNCSGQTRDSWTTITKQTHTAVDHSDNNTVLRIKGV